MPEHDIRAVFDAAGLPQGFYDAALDPPERIPASAVAISDADWLAFRSGGWRWDGTGRVEYTPPPLPPVVPEAISDRQFAQVLALDGVITQDEALAWAARGELPERLNDALEHIPEADGQRFGARMMLSAATTYERHHPLVPTLGALLGMDATALDAVWTRGAEL